MNLNGTMKTKMMMNDLDPRVGEIYENRTGTRYLILEVTNIAKIHYRLVHCGDKLDESYLGREATIDVNDMWLWGWKIRNQVDKGIDNDEPT